MIFQNASFLTTLFFVLWNFKNRAMANSLVRVLKFHRAKKEQLKNRILEDYGYIDNSAHKRELFLKDHELLEY